MACGEKAWLFSQVVVVVCTYRLNGKARGRYRSTAMRSTVCVCATVGETVAGITAQGIRVCEVGAG